MTTYISNNAAAPAWEQREEKQASFSGNDFNYIVERKVCSVDAIQLNI